MTIQEQKIILRLLTPEQIAEMFPLEKGERCHMQSDKYWICTRLIGHGGPHVRHPLGGKITTGEKLPFAWLNEKE